MREYPGVTVAFIVLLLALESVVSAFSQTVSEDARRHYNRGLAAVEMAKSTTDYEDAINEFGQAAQAAPGWADPYYSMGLVQEKAGKYRDAIKSLEKYLQLAPKASDAATVKDRISQLEYKAEQEITRGDALEIFGSLSDTTKWDFHGENSGYKNWVSRFRREGDRIAVAHWFAGGFEEWGELVGNTIMKVRLVYPNFCNPTKDCCGNETVYYRGVASCAVVGDYQLEIVSKRKVVVSGTELWPRIFNYQRASTKQIRLEYTRK